MGRDALQWVWDHSPFTGATLTVHLAIGRAVRADNLFALPVPELAADARCGPRAVMTALSELAAGGFLELLEVGGGRGKPARYQLLTPDLPRRSRTLGADKPRDLNTVFSDKPRDIRGVSSRAPAVLALSLEGINTNTRANGETIDSFVAEFESWWKDYPRKVDKAKAREQFTRRRRERVTLETLTTARDAYRATVADAEPRFVLHAATFLAKNGRWSDDWTVTPEPAEPKWIRKP